MPRMLRAPELSNVTPVSSFTVLKIQNNNYRFLPYANIWNSHGKYSRKAYDNSTEKETLKENF